MAYVNTRQGPRGTRYTGMYRDKAGAARSAGTYDTHDRALEVAMAKEAQIAFANETDPVRKATITINDYYVDWLRRHQVAPVTKASYASVLDCHIVPALGKHRVAEITKEQIRTWLADLQKAGMKPVLHRRCRMVLSAMMHTAQADGYRDDNPVSGLTTQTIVRKRIKVLTTEQFDDLYDALPTDGAKLLAEVVVSTGMRYGEATALTPGDFDIQTGMVGIWKVISDVGAEFHPDGRSRFLAVPYTKDKLGRDVSVGQELCALVHEYAMDNGIGPDDLLFPASKVLPPNARTFPSKKERQPLTEEFVATLGEFVGPNGLTYQHGTVNGYATGKDKCEYCRQAMSEYSSDRRAARRGAAARKKAKTRSRTASDQNGDYLAREAWRRVWRKAVAESKVPFTPNAYQLRHTHASWLTEQNIDVKKIMERLGHKDLRVTSLYITTVSIDEESVAAMDNLRSGRRGRRKSA